MLLIAQEQMAPLVQVQNPLLFLYLLYKMATSSCFLGTEQMVLQYEGKIASMANILKAENHDILLASRRLTHTF